MTCQRFEELPVWQKAADLYEATEELHLNRRTREQEEQSKKAKSLQKDLLRKLPADHPLRRDAEARGLLRDLKLQI